MGMQKLYGIFDGEHVIRLLFINLVDDRRQGSRFAGAGGAGHEHDSIAEADDLAQYGWQVERIEIWDLSGNYAHHDGTGTALHEDIHTKPVGTGQTVGHIAGTAFLQVLNRMLVIAHQIGRNSPGVVAGENTCRSGGSEFSTNFDKRWLTGREEEVANLGRSFQHRHEHGGSRKRRRGRGGRCGGGGACGVGWSGSRRNYIR